jgi:hypothetical protein
MATEGQALQLVPHALTLVFFGQIPEHSCVPSGH